MNPKTPSRVRASMFGLMLSCAGLAAIPAAMAQTFGQPYYDPVRDVMVTPVLSGASPRVGYGPAPVQSSPGAVGVTREPIYGTVSPPSSRQFYGAGRAYTPTRASTSGNVIPPPVPGIQAVPESSAGLEQPPTAGISPSPASASASPSESAAWQQVYAAAPPEPSMPKSYYDPVRDVMITPTQSGSVRYIGAPQRQQLALARGASSSFELVIRNGQLLRGPASMTVDHGAEVTLVIDSNVADTLRIDGYNLVAPVAAGNTMLLKFVAEQPGRFAFRLGSGRQIGVLEVGPPQPSNRIGMR
jgi:hypothetical protein